MSKALRHAKAVEESKPASLRVKAHEWGGLRQIASVDTDGRLVVAGHDSRAYFSPDEAVLLGRWIQENYGIYTEEEISGKDDRS